MNTSWIKTVFYQKGRECDKWKADLVKITIFAKRSIVDAWEGSKYVSVSDFEYNRVLNMPGLNMVLNMPEEFLNVPEYAQCV